MCLLVDFSNPNNLPAPISSVKQVKVQTVEEIVHYPGEIDEAKAAANKIRQYQFSFNGESVSFPNI